MSIIVGTAVEVIAAEALEQGGIEALNPPPAGLFDTLAGDHVLSKANTLHAAPRNHLTMRL